MTNEQTIAINFALELQKPFFPQPNSINLTCKLVKVVIDHTFIMWHFLSTSAFHRLYNVNNLSSVCSKKKIDKKCLEREKKKKKPEASLRMMNHGSAQEYMLPDNLFGMLPKLSSQKL